MYRSRFSPLKIDKNDYQFQEEGGKKINQIKLHRGETSEKYLFLEIYTTRTFVPEAPETLKHCGLIKFGGFLKNFDGFELRYDEVISRIVIHSNGARTYPGVNPYYFVLHIYYTNRSPSQDPGDPSVDLDKKND